MRGYPVADRAAAGILGEALRAVGYSDGSVSDLLGDDAYSIDADSARVGERRLPQTALGTVVRAFFLERPVSTQAAVRALGRRALDALEATGLAEVGDGLVPRVRIVPIGDLLVASDDFPKTNGDPQYVAAYSATSRICDALTPRPKVARALDVGTGSGVQALRAAGHARHVVATDVNPRALAYTELNAALNGFTNIECRSGSLFEPVDGERFDLITANAPYVVSPEHRLAYRDAGLEGDELSERIVRGTANHLADGGFATMLVSWIAEDEDEPDERPLDWTAATGCDSWILPVWEADPLDHAATWNDHLAGNRFGDAVDKWTDYFARLGARWVSEGAVLLHRRPGGRHSARVDLLDEDAIDEAGRQIQRAFESRARLTELRRPEELLDARLSVAVSMLLERELKPRRGAPALVASRLHVDEGIYPTVEATAPALELVASLDGRAPLGGVVEQTADRLGLSEREASRLRREALEVSRELLELGALRFR
jgi:methylase of polypeptide subunit release factors